MDWEQIDDYYWQGTPGGYRVSRSRGSGGWLYSAWPPAPAPGEIPATLGIRPVFEHACALCEAHADAEGIDHGG